MTDYRCMRQIIEALDGGSAALMVAGLLPSSSDTPRNWCVSEITILLYRHHFAFERGT